LDIAILKKKRGNFLVYTQYKQEH